MEYNQFNCPSCKASYGFYGYKTGFGKTPERLSRLADDGHVCKRCGYDDRVGGQGKLEDVTMTTDNPTSRMYRAAAGTVSKLITDMVTPTDDPDRIPTKKIKKLSPEEIK